MSKINIDRIVKDIRTRTTSLTPIIEAVCNSIDAINPSRKDGKIDIIIKRDGQQSLELESGKTMSDIIGIDIVDNGEGFTESNRDSFDTFRSGLKSNKGGKGFGRFMYLKYFNHVTVESVYKSELTESDYLKRKFTFGHADEIIENETIEKLDDNSIITTGTILHLISIKNKDLDKGLEVIARKLVERLLAFFAVGGENMPTITIKEEDGSNSIILNEYVGPDSDIRQIGNSQTITIKGRSQSYNFLVKIYKIYYSAISNKICLAANMREVTDSPLHNYIPEFKETMFETDDTGTQKNYMVKAYVQGEYLDTNVTTERDAFNFGKEDDTFYDLSERIIYKEAAQITKQYFLEDIKERFAKKKENLEHYVYHSAPWNKPLLKQVDMENIPVEMSELDMEMMFQKIKFDNEQKTRISIKEVLCKTEDELNEDNIPEVESDIRKILSLISESQKNDLAHYVCQRKKVIDLFDELRKRIDNGRPHRESEMHNLIYPMIKNDREIEYDDNNLWLLDERFNFTQYIASDKVISREDHKEPDLAIFYESGLFYRSGDNNITSPIAIVEFKRPKRDNYTDNENPINQALRYAGKILDGKYEFPNGIEKIEVDKDHTPVYIYIIADIVPKISEFAEFAGLMLGPDKQCYYGYNKKYNAYIEIKSFKKVIDDAKMRNQIFFKKLGII